MGHLQRLMDEAIENSTWKSPEGRMEEFERDVYAAIRRNTKKNHALLSLFLSLAICATLFIPVHQKIHLITQEMRYSSISVDEDLKVIEIRK